jgi:hypothetical protein
MHSQQHHRKNITHNGMPSRAKWTPVLPETAKTTRISSIPNTIFRLAGLRRCSS